MLRISVNGGGCSGFQYAFDVERQRQADDLVIEKDGATVLVTRSRSSTWTAPSSTSWTT
jgi:Fe-S cluster assembly iron-binding protein IscA